MSPGHPGPSGPGAVPASGSEPGTEGCPHPPSPSELWRGTGEVALGAEEDCVVLHAGQTLDTAGSQKAIGGRLILESWSGSV